MIYISAKTLSILLPKASVTQCDLSATILLNLVDPYLIALKSRH